MNTSEPKQPIRRLRIVSESSRLFEAQVFDHDSGTPIHVQAFTITGTFAEGPHRGQIVATITLPATLDIVGEGQPQLASRVIHVQCRHCDGDVEVAIEPAAGR